MYKLLLGYEYKVHMKQNLSSELGPNLLIAHLYVQIFQSLKYFESQIFQIRDTNITVHK